MNRIDILQALINKNGYTNFLEIGVQGGSCFNAIQCETKVGVDPDKSSAATVHLTSDEFFELNENSKMQDDFIAKFDIIFIDGLHHADQVYKDVINSLACLKKGGTIVMHDCLPNSKRMQEIPLEEQDEWCGNVWEAVVKLRMEHENISFCTVSTDWGCGILRPSDHGVPKIFIDVPITWEYFCIYKDIWMNVISVEQFKEIYL